MGLSFRNHASELKLLAQSFCSQKSPIWTCLEMSSGSHYQGERPCLSVLLASGHPRHIGFVGERGLSSHGVAYHTCDGEFFTGKVFVIGGGFAAAEEKAYFLTKYAEARHGSCT